MFILYGVLKISRFTLKSGLSLKVNPQMIQNKI